MVSIPSSSARTAGRASRAPGAVDQHRPGRGDDVDDAGQLAARQGVAQGGADRVHGGEPVEVDEQRLGTDGPDVHGRGGAQPTTRCSRADVWGCRGWPTMARSST